MKIMFNGIIEKTRKGCGACGRRRTENQFMTSRTYILPSGITKTFIAGRVEDVSDRDGNFLLQYKYQTPEGETKNVFEVVGSEPTWGP